MLTKAGAKQIFVLFTIPACLLLFTGCPSLPAGKNGSPTDIENGQEIGRPDPIHDYRVYYVRPGDTLFSIGARFNARWQDIQALNSVDAASLEAGRVLLIPIPTESASEKVSDGAGGRYDPGRNLQKGRVVGDKDNTGGRWIWPLQGRIAREYGDALHGLPEPGIAISAPANTGVRAVADGKVIFTIRRPNHLSSGWGNVVAIRHEQKMVSWYAYLGSIRVREGARVRRGDIIATVGKAGTANNNQIAFRLFHNERPVNPERYMPQH